MNNYRDKLLSIPKLRKKVGRFPRQRKVVLCHGCFDLVHPGHILHFEEAKRWGTYLVVSITKDQYVRMDKGEGHPYIEESLRALNLAALEMVDFVLIDERPHPCELLLRLKPDVYVKGKEYRNSSKLMRLEGFVVKQYGGSIKFTSGAVVMSSTALWSRHE